MNRMSRRLPDLPVSDAFANTVFAGALGIIGAVTLVLAVQYDKGTGKPGTASVTPYENCLQAANEPDPSGYATEVCEPLMPEFQEPALTAYPSDFDLAGCFTVPARADSDPIRYCPAPEATP